ncbi:DegT/DnrJ/EryC1/StrS family aminotransferase, partial [Erysipelotrichaceae bacterium HCN-30851]
EKITEKTKAILVVHLYGQATEMKKIKNICEKYNLKLVEDCAQSHGAKYNEIMTGNLSDIACWSFYPSKNLGAFGDGGVITTNNSKLAEFIKILRNYGSEKRYHNMVVGYNSRLDELQAGLLRVKLKHIDTLLKDRERIALKYLNGIKNKKIKLPKICDNCTHVWHLFVIQCDERDKLIEYLNENNIQTLVHYPIPPHKSEAYRYLNIKKDSLPFTEYLAEHVLTLPLYNGMNEEEIDYVIEIINKY